MPQTIKHDPCNQNIISPIDITSYNITSYFIVIGTALWIPFGFCRSDEYLPEPIMDAERHRISTTNGRQRMSIYRPHQDEDNHSTTDGTREQLPSYFEMMRPPSYKNPMPESPNTNNDSSPSADISSRPPSINDTDYYRYTPSIDVRRSNEPAVHNNNVSNN